jgi:amidohydrolase
VDAAFALHGWPELELGRVVVGCGPVMAAATAFEVTISGRGTHAAFPHTGNDVVLAGAHTITALQSIASRWDPVDPVLVSVCALDAGHTYNVLPDRCQLKGTVRGLRQAAHDRVLEKVQQISGATAEMFGCQAELEVISGYPTLVNDPTCAELVAQAAGEMLGADSVVTDPAPVMGAEDFAFYARQVPAAWLRIGVADPDGPACPALHSTKYNFDDRAIPIGVAMLCEIAHRFLSKPPTWRCG